MWLPIIIIMLFSLHFPQWFLSQAKRIILNEPAFVCLDTIDFYNGKDSYPTETSDYFDENNRAKIIINDKITKESFSVLYGISYNSDVFKVYCNNQEAYTEIESTFRDCDPLSNLYLSYHFKAKLFLHHGINKIIIKNREKEEAYFVEVLKEGEDEDEPPEEAEDT